MKFWKRCKERLKMALFATLDEWLNHLEQGQTNGVINLGLERIIQVKNNMQLNPTCPIITVAGTNGKGSVCAFLTTIYRESGFKVGTLTSPHILKFNERIAINAEPVSDEEIIQSFEKIEQNRQSTSLTYFEFNTLAAIDIFIENKVDVIILEVGLGGRLDATNAWEADVSIVVSVDIDHQNFLGNDIETIAYEKAGIFRANRYAICGQNPPPKSLIEHAQKLGAKLLITKQDFSTHIIDEKQWSYKLHPINSSFRLPEKNRHSLPTPVLRGTYQINNAACAITAIECLNTRLPIDNGAIRKGLLLAINPARFQVLAGRPIRILDVGHNPHAARALRQDLRKLPFAQKRIAIFSMLNDKDMASVINILKSEFDEWRIAPLDVSRTRSVDNMIEILNANGIEPKNIKTYNNIKTAWRETLTEISENDRIVAFGSFHTVAQIMNDLD